ncbi:MAG: orotate phosphoribosyltransferase [Bacteroides sp.]|nr:orotate phosphoribosyltransferase [Bacteroidales bacterium]MBD5302682.1 orotate phosphoribosyltransferase [Bacteroides sp.]MBD5205540.1 orotate phosphoribosyltransferase [Bacteroidales bacterium]MBD5223375.1 orotate phosphoribosyltransferase [Bacteroidales bacterium]MBD5304928.1 orotate phosphoribosyltransferase [Bacteroides sp.]
MKNPDRLLADKFLEISAVKLQPEMPFVWGSGWNSPIYNDNRRILSYPDVRNFVKVELAKTVLESYPEVETIAAVSVAAIPFGTMVADVLGVPFVYVRSSPKDHGLENQIEGDLHVGKKVVMVEDIVATGGGSLRAAEAIRFSACEVLGGVCVFDYEFPATVKRLRDANIEMKALCRYDVLVEAAISVKYIHPSQESLLKGWRKDPANWVPEN